MIHASWMTSIYKLAKISMCSTETRQFLAWFDMAKLAPSPSSPPNSAFVTLDEVARAGAPEISNASSSAWRRGEAMTLS